jgi:hypothetical protein
MISTHDVACQRVTMMTMMMGTMKMRTGAPDNSLRSLLLHELPCRYFDHYGLRFA